MTAPSELSRQAQRLTRLYILALAAVACLSILGQVLVQWSLDRQQSDSTVVNLAGRQRMLSQRLTKAALALERATTEAEQTARRSEISAVLAQWRTADDGLRRGSSVLRLPGRNTLAVQQMFAALQPHFQAMGSAADEILASESANPKAIDSLLAVEPQFLAAMDETVLQFEREARSRVAWLQGTERGLLLLTLIVLACEGALVFYPAVRRLRAAAREMEQSREQLEIAKQQADSASELKSQFLATMSHELRNPLQAIQGSVELASQTNADSQQQEHLATISTAASTLLVLLNDLLDLARIEAGKLAIVNAPFDPVLLMQRTLALVQPQAIARQLQLHFESDADVPRSTIGDELRVQQVLLNLLNNAIKFTPEGSVHVRLKCESSSEQAPQLRWEVCDTGPGIGSETQSHIFEPFVQGDPASSRTTGVGLGLAICHRLVHLMDGAIGLTSVLGSGSTFWFELPLPIAPTSGSQDNYSPRQATQKAALAVLLVDDDPVNRRVLSQLLETLGHSVLAVSCGAEAIDRFRKQPFDAAILDWQLPDMTGGQLAAKLREATAAPSHQSVRLIALSAAIPKFPAHGKTADFDLWLAKPVGLNDLAQALDSSPATHESDQFTSTVDLVSTRWEAVLARLDGRQEILSQLADTWLTNLPETLNDLQAAANDQNFDKLAKLSHLLAGQASNFNASSLEAAARTLEQASHTGQSNDSQISDVIRHCQLLATDLTSISLTRNKPGPGVAPCYSRPEQVRAVPALNFNGPN